MQMLKPASDSGGDLVAAYHGAREGAAVFDLSCHGKITLSGSEAAPFLHNLCTNDILNLPAGSGCEAFLTTAQAKVIAHAFVFGIHVDGESALWLDVGPGLGEKVYRHLDRHLISEQVAISDLTDECGQLYVTGARAQTVIGELLAADLAGGLTDLRAMTATLPWGPCQVRRRDILEMPGYDFVCRKEHLGAAWEWLRGAGAVPAGFQVYDVLRIEAGFPLAGVDFDESNLPQEVGRLERTVSFSKGCYIGQETVARIRTYGHVNRSLVGFKLTGDTAASRGDKLSRDGKEVGHITSSAVSPRLGAIALGYIRRGHELAGTLLEVDRTAGRVSAEVVALPFGGVAAAP